jgi:TonB-linked SusC/RagA family outer membrane protein
MLHIPLTLMAVATLVFPGLAESQAMASADRPPPGGHPEEASRNGLLDRPAHLEVVDAPLGAALGEPIAGSEARPPTMRRPVATALRPLQPRLTRTGTIAGQVVDINTGRPLVGTQIQLVGLELGALADANGEYRIPNVPAGEVTVRALIIGYATATRTVTLRAGETERVDFQLRQEALGLDAIVVTGTPGEQQARSLGNVLGRVHAAEMQQVAPSHTVEALLGGAEPGVNVQIGGGAVGSGANVRIRGASSIALSSQPLVYVDGVRVFGGPDRGGGVAGLATRSQGPTSRLNDINPEDIETIEVIKGPAAATLYGTEASNGVINIITKKGALGAPRIHMTLKQGANWYPDPERLFPSTYFRCQGTSGTCTPGEIVEFNVLREDRVRHGLTHFRTGAPMGVGGSVDGGSETLRYYFSLDFDRDEGVVSYNWQNQLSGRANLNWTVSDRLDVQFGLGAVRSRLQTASPNQPVTTAILWACPAPGCEEGSGLPNAVDGDFRGYIGYLPEVLANDVEGLMDVHRSTYNLTLTHRPFDWLTHRLVTGVDWTDSEESELYRPIDGVGHFQPQGRKRIQAQSSQFLSLDYSATATVEPWDEVQLSTSAGLQYYQKEQHWVYTLGNIFPVPDLETVSAGAQRDGEEDFLENKTLGAYIQEQFAWRNRLFLTAAIRGDDNSAFGEDFEFVVYPKFSGSWVISEEEFMADVEPVSQLRLRGAWGRAGQQPDVFAALRIFEPIPGPGGQSALTPQNLGNPDLKPEVGDEIELGFDAGLFEDRLGVEFTYYNQRRKDAIIRVPVRPSRGFPGIQFRNLGEVVNRGVELGLNANLYRAGPRSVDLRVAYARNSNEITSMGGLAPQVLDDINPTTGWAQQYYVEGFPLGAIFQKRVVSAEIQGTGADAVARNVMCEGGEVLPGSPNLARGNGSVVPCAEAPHLFRGSPIPTTELSTAASVGLSDHLQLYAQVDYMGGHKMVDGSIAGAHLFFRNTRAILERTDPILLGYEALGRDGANQAGLMDASFAKLRRVSLVYTLPSTWVERMGAERMSLTLSGHNLWTIWQATPEMFGVKNVDPELRHTAGTASDPGGLSAYTQEDWPPMRRFLATLRVTF